MSLLERAISKTATVVLAFGLIASVIWLGLSVLQLLKAEPLHEVESSEKISKIERAASIEIKTTDLDQLKSFKSRVLLGQAPAPVLAAELQARLRVIAQALSVDVVQASELTPQEATKIPEIGIKLDLTGPSAGILRFVKDIESFEPWLRVSNATLRSGFIDTAPLQAEPMMTANLEIWGYAQPSPAVPAP